MDKKRIRAKAILGLPLTARERATYLLLIATDDEAKAFLEREKGSKLKNDKIKNCA